ncbi:HD domain-containing protein [Clostridium sardiniense]|uniref:HD domain-containing protein n=1 Tax=Clostridium sardiniense TaxID=29369 RepID=A0ABS7L1N1_CLOSR|nr:HD domain-containing protein [Clostridium sardiniense]MBY0756980.1 HD domain-containing protein [Clostridium sardiniense]MDQ0460378.1 uncharacterized protein [Clostridium sardiniense]
MKRVNQILNNETFKINMGLLDKLEKDREFCRHGLDHSLDLARIAYIKSLEEDIKISKEIIYAVALLHDLGRVLQYTEGVPHHEGSVILAKQILKDTSFNDEERALIIDGIEKHREINGENSFNKLIQDSDKLSRNCFSCKSYDKCYWDSNKKNNLIKY